MSEFRVSGDMFGRYVTILTGFNKQQHVYKVVGMIESNGYCDVPITGWTENIHHDEIVPVLLVIHCGICEEKVIRVALKDCTFLEAQETPKSPCFLCDNARVNDDLTDRNDLHYRTVGDSDDGFRVMVGAGWGRPLRILFEQRRRVHPSWSEESWVTVGIYEPKFCPNCGRELWEYGGGQK